MGQAESDRGNTETRPAGQMCGRRRDLGITSVQVLVKDRGVCEPGEPAVTHPLCCQIFFLSLKK